jgi:hypothetical protein
MYLCADEAGVVLRGVELNKRYCGLFYAVQGEILKSGFRPISPVPVLDMVLGFGVLLP